MTTQAQEKAQASGGREHDVAGIALMLIGIFFFSVNDTMGKWLISTYSVGQVLLLRSISAIIILSPFIAKAGIGAFFNAPRPWLQVLRAAFATFEVACFYWALSGMSLADTMTFYLAGPIYVTAVSPFLLGEHVGWRRWMAVVAGFVGVMVALGPRGGRGGGRRGGAGGAGGGGGGGARGPGGGAGAPRARGAGAGGRAGASGM